jgi:hypothetical protein
MITFTNKIVKPSIPVGVFTKAIDLGDFDISLTRVDKANLGAQSF